MPWIGKCYLNANIQHELPIGTSPNITVAQNSTATITYSVRNNTNIARILTMKPINAVKETAIPGSPGSCNFPSVLGPKTSCNLNLLINGAEVPASGLSGGLKFVKQLGQEIIVPMSIFAHDHH